MKQATQLSQKESIVPQNSHLVQEAPHNLPPLQEENKQNHSRQPSHANFEDFLNVNANLEVDVIEPIIDMLTICTPSMEESKEIDKP